MAGFTEQAAFPFIILRRDYSKTSCVVLLLYTSFEVYTKYGMASTLALKGRQAANQVMVLHNALVVTDILAADSLMV